MNILCIGNSFSQDATRYLHQISDEELYVRNLYIGGCSLETHWNNIVESNEIYEYQKNGRMRSMTSINKALTKKKWDYITIQQVSHDSGMPHTYEPFLTNILNYIREKCPKAEIVFHRTWAYDDNSTHGGFVNYDNDIGNRHSFGNPCCNAASITVSLLLSYSLTLSPFTVTKMKLFLSS